MTRSRNETAAALALTHLENESWARLARDVRDRRSAVAILEERGHFQGDLFGDEPQTQAIIEHYELLLSDLAERGVGAIAINDPHFPSDVAELNSPPLFLFHRGKFSDADRDGIAVIGSRKVSQRSLSITREWARLIARSGTVVISGLAAGVDREAHLGALDEDARTVAVIGTGILRAYPKENSPLQEQIADSGLVVSQFLPDAAPSKTSFPMRNAVMAAWGRATLVIDADDRSGASLQARLATEQGSRLFLHEQLRHQVWAKAFVDAGKAVFVSEPSEIVPAS